MPLREIEFLKPIHIGVRNNMKTAIKIALESFILFVLTFMLSLEHILIANVYDITCLSYLSVAAYCMCCWVAHRSCGMHNVHLGFIITVMICIITFVSVECILHKDEKGCRDWILKTIEANYKQKSREMTESFFSKEKSYGKAMDILALKSNDEIIKEICELKDVEALRVIAATANIATWRKRYAPDTEFDKRMEGVFQAAMHKLFLSDSDSARDAIEYCKHLLPLDESQSILLKQWEEERQFLNGSESFE